MRGDGENAKIAMQRAGDPTAKRKEKHEMGAVTRMTDPTTKKEKSEETEKS